MSTALIAAASEDYFILAARSLGLDCGTISGFENEQVDREFIPPSSPGSGGKTDGFIADGAIKSNFLCNHRYGDASKPYPRDPRLDFDEACQLL